MVVSGYEDVRRRAAAPGGGENWIARIAGALPLDPVIPRGHDHHDVGPDNGQCGDTGAGFSGVPLPHEPIAPPADSRRSPYTFPTTARPALRPTRLAGPGTSLIPPPLERRNVPSNSDPPAPRPHLPPSQRSKEDEGSGGTAPAVMGRASLGWGCFVFKSHGARSPVGVQ